MALVIIFGPGAVGKMTVGHELAQRTGLRLFHNHLTLDLVLRFFDWGEPPFHRLVSEFRTRIVEEVAASDSLPGLIFTYVWAFDQPSDTAHVDHISGIFRAKGSPVYFVELQASQDVRLERNTTSFRLAEKVPKRNVELSRKNLLANDANHRLRSTDEFAGRTDDYVRIDNTMLSPEIVAEQIIDAFALPRTEG